MLKPWFRGYSGNICEVGPNQYQTTGKFTVNKHDRVEITELPIGVWTGHYKQMLEQMAQNNTVHSIEEFHKDNQVHFVVHIPEIYDKFCQNGAEAIIKDLRLAKTISLNNMMLFNQDSQIKKYASPTEIINEFYPIRLAVYEKRKQHQLKVIRADLKILTSKFRFIKGISDGSIDFKQMSKPEMI